jgi:hypothetical protein
MSLHPTLILGIPVAVRGELWTIRQRSAPIHDADGVRCKILPDPARETVWLDPELPASELLAAVARAVCIAHEHARARRRARRLRGRRRRIYAPRPAENRRPTGAELEALPDGERVSDADFLAAMWKATSALPMPPGLPPGVTLDVDRIPGHAPNTPPNIVSTAGGRERHLCPVCGARFIMPARLGRHLKVKHGWARDASGWLAPPQVDGTEAA